MIATSLERKNDLEALAKMTGTASKHVEPSGLSPDELSARKFAAVQLEAYFEEKRRLAELWTPEFAKLQAARDIDTFRAAPDNARLFFGAGIALQSAANPAYQAEIQSATPELAKPLDGVTAASGALVDSFQAARPGLDKDDRKQAESLANEKMRVAEVVAWTPAQIFENAQKFKTDYAYETETLGDNGFYARADMLRDTNANPAYRAEILKVAPDVLALAESDRANMPTLKVQETLGAAFAAAAAAPSAPLKNTMEADKDQPILNRTDYIVPRAVASNYNELDGKFFAKDSQRLMFEDKGKSLATSTDDKKAVADMVALAKSKNWSEFQLSGSKDFRREAWLQAESQGIKTRGYTPKDGDLAALKSLTEERQKNSITPIVERRKEVETTITTNTPRHDFNKNQAALFAAGEAGKAANSLILKDKPAFQDLKQKELDAVAFWRGIVMEQNKDQPASIQETRLAEFDGKMADPKMRQALPDPALGSIESDVKINIKAAEHKHPEHELSL
jgi:Large polyvalent protein-associated domain 7